MSDVVREHGYEIFFFAGQKRYRSPCEWESGAKCKYDTYDLEEMHRHAMSPHTRDGMPKAPRTRTVVSPILDVDGKNITRTYEVELPPDADVARFRK